MSGCDGEGDRRAHVDGTRSIRDGRAVEQVLGSVGSGDQTETGGCVKTRNGSGGLAVIGGLQHVSE